jgi:hypothetical protein
MKAMNFSVAYPTLTGSLNRFFVASDSKWPIVRGGIHAQPSVGGRFCDSESDEVICDDVNVRHENFHVL